MAANVIAGATLAAGLLSTFRRVYMQNFQGIASRLPRVMRLGLPTNKLVELYGAFETAPYPVRWNRGDPISSKGMKDFGWETPNYDWGRRIKWHENDRTDDQTQSLYEAATALGKHFATLDERIFFQLILGATNADLLPAVPNAADGSALYAASRYGVGAGNILSGTGVASAATIIADFYNAIEVFRQFQDTEGQPLWDEDLVKAGFVVVYNVANDQAFREAFEASTMMITKTLQNVAGSENIGIAGAAIDNVIVKTGIPVELWPTQRITDNDWFIFATGVEDKSLYQQTRAPLREAFATMENSDYCRDTKMEYVQWDNRAGYGIAVPFDTMKVNN